MSSEIHIMGDNSECPNGNINPVSQAFGTKVGISILLPYDLYINSLSGHPIFEEVSQIYMRAAGDISGSSPSSEEAWADTGEAVVTVAESGSGRVVATGDINFCDNEYIGYSNNQLFSENVFDWLIVGGMSNPVPDIRANGSDGPVTIAPGDALSVIIALDCADNLGDDADWWILAKSPSGGWYHYRQGSGWNSGQSVTHQGALFDVSSYQVLNTSSLTTPGLYKFYFAVDMIMNGSIDMGQRYYDSVDVNVSP